MSDQQPTVGSIVQLAAAPQDLSRVPEPLRPHAWKPGQSGNPAGRPKTVSLRDKIRQYLEDNPMEVERLVKHFVENNPELMWQMLEGRPAQAHMIGGPGGEPIGEPSDLVKELANKINEIHGGAGVGGHGAVPGPLGPEAPHQERGGPAD